jgi:hypothetical protein
MVTDPLSCPHKKRFPRKSVVEKTENIICNNSGNQVKSLRCEFIREIYDIPERN